MARLTDEEFARREAEGTAFRDPDATPREPSQLERTELALRALKLRHNQKQAQMTEDANKITAYPTKKEE